MRAVSQYIVVVCMWPPSDMRQEVGLGTARVYEIAAKLCVCTCIVLHHGFIGTAHIDERCPSLLFIQLHVHRCSDTYYIVHILPLWKNTLSVDIVVGRRLPSPAYYNGEFLFFLFHTYS